VARPDHGAKAIMLALFPAFSSWSFARNIPANKSEQTQLDAA
jgi:hypothetical protein